MRLFDTPLTQLGARDRARWTVLAHPDGQLISPYLLPEFAELVNAQRGDVRVVIAEENAQPVGYFAYHAPSGGVARPVGAPLSDYQGFAGAPDLDVPQSALLEAMGADVLVYDNWRGAAPGKVRTRAGSSVIDLSEGVEAWEARKRAQHRTHFKKMGQRRRKAEREWGEVRVVFGDPLGDRFEAMRGWKRDQYRRSGLLDLFDVTWVDHVLESCAARAFGPFRGFMASLYLGDQLAAVDMGLIAGGVMHSWMPAYDPRFAQVSPGHLLLHGVIEAAPNLGVTRIDLGAGEHAYKQVFADYEVPLCGGRAMAPSLAAASLTAWDGAEQVAKVLPAPLDRAPAKLRRRWAQTAAAEPALSARLRRMAEAFGNAPQRLMV